VGVASTTLAVPTASATNASLHVTQILLGSSLHHSFTLAGSTTVHTDALTNPDDISQWGGDLYVGFQNGVGPQGQASTDGNIDSTVVELTLSGHVLAQWNVIGKTDGVTVDPGLGVLATVNEDANSALYLIRPWAPASDAVTRFTYNETLPHLGGTDAISIYDGRILISASAPGTNGSAAPQPTYPAVYSVTLDEATKVASVSPLFFDESSATIANLGSTFGSSTQLGLCLLYTSIESKQISRAYSQFAVDTLKFKLEIVRYSWPKSAVTDARNVVTALSALVADRCV